MINSNIDKEELVKFVEWLPTNVEEFKNKSPKEIITVLNKLSQTEEGMNTISELINQFKGGSQVFKFGGTLSFLKKGGKYSRKTARANKEKLGIRNSENRQEITGANNILAKIAKAAAVEGFDGAEFNFDSNQEFDRKKFREMKRWAKENTDFNRRERKAFALLHNLNESVTRPNLLPDKFDKFLPEYELPKPKRYTKGIVVVGEPINQDTGYKEPRAFEEIKEDLKTQAFGNIPTIGTIQVPHVTVNYTTIPKSYTGDVRDIIQGMGFGEVKVPKFRDGETLPEEDKALKTSSVLNRLRKSKANFAKRIQDPNRKTISDWRDPSKQLSHKLSYVVGDDGIATVYPLISAGYNGELTDFSNPKFERLTAVKNPGYEIAIMNRDTMRMPEVQAKEFIKILENIVQ